MLVLWRAAERVVIHPLAGARWGGGGWVVQRWYPPKREKRGKKAKKERKERRKEGRKRKKEKKEKKV